MEIYLAQDTVVAKLSNMGLNTKINQPTIFLSRKGNLKFAFSTTYKFVKT